MKLKAQLLSMFILLSLIPLVLMGAVGSWLASTSLRESANALLAQHAKSMAAIVEERVASGKLLTQSISAQPDVRLLLEAFNREATADQGKLNTMKYFLRNLAEASNGSIEALHIVDVSGVIRIEGVKEYDMLVGEAVTHGLGSLSLEIASEQAWGEPFLSPADETQLIPFIQPIQTVTGNIGYVVIWYRLDALSATLPQLPQGEVAIISNQQQLIHSQVTTLKRDTLENFFLVDRASQMRSKYLLHHMAIEDSPWVLWGAISESIAMKQRNTLLVMTIAITAVFSLVIVIATLWYTKRLSRGLERLGGQFHRLGEGKLQHMAPERATHELTLLSEDYNAMVSKISEVMSETQSASTSLSEVQSAVEDINGQVHQFSVDLSDNLQAISGGVVTQHAGFSESYERVTEVSVRLEHVIQSQEALKQHASRTAQSTEIGISAMDAMAATVAQGAIELKEVAATSREFIAATRSVDEILGHIQSIARRTNLLALNASIESARAGVHGLGFSVVANEIRALSEQVQQEVGRISAIVSDMNLHSDRMAQKMSDTEISFGNQVKATEGARAHFAAIAGNIGDSLTAIDEISEAIAAAKADQHRVVEIASKMIEITEDTRSQTEGISSAMDQLEAVRLRIHESTENLVDAVQALQDAIGHFGAADLAVEIHSEAPLGGTDYGAGLYESIDSITSTSENQAG